MIDAGPLIDLVATLVNELNENYGDDARLELGVITLELSTDETRNLELEEGAIIEHRSTSVSAAHVLGALELAADSVRSGFVRADEE
jgi:hypothetical protein